MSQRPEANLSSIDKLCDEFEANWKQGSPPQIQSFLAKVSDFDREFLLSELLGFVAFKTTPMLST